MSKRQLARRGIVLYDQDCRAERGRTVHAGGAIATLINCAMGSAIASTLEDGQAPVTADTTIKYLNPGWPGQLTASASLVKKGKRLTVLQTEGTQSDSGEEMAFATAPSRSSKPERGLAAPEGAASRENDMERRTYRPLIWNPSAPRCMSLVYRLLRCHSTEYVAESSAM
ncbi:MAG: PaaI family thioesterase [Actinomycetota bacterium]